MSLLPIIAFIEKYDMNASFNKFNGFLMIITISFLFQNHLLLFLYPGLCQRTRHVSNYQTSYRRPFHLSYFQMIDIWRNELLAVPFNCFVISHNFFQIQTSFIHNHFCFPSSTSHLLTRWMSKFWKIFLCCKVTCCISNPCLSGNLLMSRKTVVIDVLVFS